MNIVDGLLRIKQMREEVQQANTHRARRMLEEASEALRRAGEEQQRRNRERSEREESLYKDVCSRTVVVRDLNDLQDEVKSMKEAAKDDEQAVTQAKTERQGRRQAAEDATHAWAAAALARQRFEDFAELERKEWERRQEWLAELELEEHPGRSAIAAAMQDGEEEA